MRVDLDGKFRRVESHASARLICHVSTCRMTACAAAFETAIFHYLTYRVGRIILVQLVAAHAVNVHLQEI